MAYKLQLKRGLLASLPNGSVGEPLFTTDTFDLYVGKGDGSNIKLQKFIASGSSSQFLKGDGSLDSTTYQGVLSGTGIVKSTGGTISYLTDNTANWDSAYNDKINSASVTGTTTKTLTLTQQDGGTITASWSDYDTAPVTSVFGRTGAVVAASGDYTTSLVTEGTNLYFTDARARAAITLTTTGSSGSATYVGGTLNVPTYTLSGLGGVPTSRSLTINGTSYDLSADRSWSVGTVTSVDLSVPTGFAITGNPITSSGTLALAFATGYSLPTNASQTNWDAAYNDKINSASVTGTTTKTLTLNQQDGGTITASWTDINTDAVTSVFGRTGAVVAASGDYTTTQVTEGTNLYYTEARVSANTDVAANTAARHSAVTLGTANGLSLSTQQLSLALASGSTTGALSSTDWTTFNGKQAALNGTGFVKISGTTISYDNSTYYLASNPSSYIAKTDLSAITPLSYDNVTGVFQMSQANSTTSGYITSTDWNTFNNKQSALTNPVTGTGTTNYLPKFTGSTTIGNSILSESGYILTQQSANALSVYVLKGTSSTTGLWLYTNGVNATLSNQDNGYLSFETNGSERMRLTSTGLGIGTTSPSYALDVTGTGRFTNAINVNSTGTEMVNINNVDSSSRQGIRLNNGINSSSGIVVFNSTSSTGTDTGGLIRGHQQSTSLSQPTAVFRQDGSADILQLQGASGADRMRVTSSGNLGLGVTPSAWNANSKALQLPQFVSLSHQNNASLNLMSFALETSSNAFTYADTGVYPLRYNQNPNNGVHSWYVAGTGTAGNAITFTQAMTLTAGGDLALGLTSPQQRLHVHNSGTSYVHISNDTTGTGGSDGADIGFFSGQSSLQINNRENADMVFSTNNTERARITSGGSLLVGCTTAPTAIGVSDLLVIGKSGSASNAINFSNGSTTNWGYLLAESGKMVLGSGASSNITFETNAGNERLRITSGGNIGIGLTNPGAKLEILGTSSDQIRLSTAATEHYRIGRNASSGFLDFYGSQTGYTGYTFGGVDGERMRITSGGNLLVGGTTSNGWKAEITGKVKSSGNTCINGTISIASGVTSTIYSIPTTEAASGIYHIFVGVLAGAQIYTASGTVTASAWNSEAVFSSIYDGSNVTLSLSGMNIQIKNDGFATLTWNYTIHFIPLTNA